MRSRPGSSSTASSSGWRRRRAASPAWEHSRREDRARDRPTYWPSTARSSRSRRRSSRTASRLREGLEVGLACEAAVREAGAVAATIGVLDGEIRVGLDATSELSRFGADARKLGPRDLAACAAQGAIGATTVGGTLTVARAARDRDAWEPAASAASTAAGRRASTSRPTSARSSNTPAIVVSAGAKSILDVPATAELLETFGVPVLGYRTDELPLFYRAEGGPAVSARVESAAEAARDRAAHWKLGGCGLLLARPPDESLDVEPLIEEGTRRGRQRRASSGQDVTPFVLAYPPRAKRRRDGRGEQEARGRERGPGGRGRRCARGARLTSRR